jgi:hypothetical protein
MADTREVRQPVKTFEQLSDDAVGRLDAVLFTDDIDLDDGIFGKLKRVEDR